MAKHRICRWLRFGILDLLILTAIVGVVAFVARPVPLSTFEAPPWIVGTWGDAGWAIVLFPDGYYAHQSPSAKTATDGSGWRLARCNIAEKAFVLTCGDSQFLVRSEWGSGTLELLNENGTEKVQLKRVVRMDGSMSDSVPHGTWMATWQFPRPNTATLEYRYGELRDVWMDGVHQLELLNRVRKARGLPELTERDFRDEGTPAEKPRD